MKLRKELMHTVLEPVFRPPPEAPLDTTAKEALPVARTDGRLQPVVPARTMAGERSLLLAMVPGTLPGRFRLDRLP